jgi:predicted extracellular nuclease
MKPVIRTLASATASALIVLWGASCSQNATPAGNQAMNGSNNTNGSNTMLMDSGLKVATVALINGRPVNYTGASVQVDAVFKMREAAGIFLLADPGGAEETLAISDAPLGALPTLKMGDIVRVTGTVETFTPDTSARHSPAFGDLGSPVSQGFYSGWNDRPVIIMTSIEKLAFPGQ